MKKRIKEKRNSKKVVVKVNIESLTIVCASGETSAIKEDIAKGLADVVNDFNK